MVKTIRPILQQLVSSLIFPAKRRDWYKRYSGVSPEERFENFLRINHRHELKPGEKSYYSQDFVKLESIKREFIDSQDTKGNKVKLDYINFTPKSQLHNPPQHIVNFFGAGEYYECNFRDMARQAAACGTVVHAFNPPGMNSSTGKVREFNDLVNSGIAIINRLLKQGVHPKDIVLQGNCLGASVAEAVHQRFLESGIPLRRINSNSFKSIKSMILRVYTKGFFEEKIKLLLQYVHWEVKPGKSFAKTSPWGAYMHRDADQTILPQAKLHAKIMKYEERPMSKGSQEYSDYEEDRKFLEGHALMTSKKEFSSQKINPHELDLYKMESVNDKPISSYEFVNEFLQRSNKWIENHMTEIYQNYEVGKSQAPSHTATHPPSLPLQEENKLLKFGEGLKEIISPPTKIKNAQEIIRLAPHRSKLSTSHHIK
jgi:hypothetical protein